MTDSAAPAAAATTFPADGRERPLRWLGAPSPMGLVLPDAHPSPSTMYAPRGVALGPRHVVVADTGNHRLLIWDDPMPGPDHCDADRVVGQPDMYSEGPKLLYLPTGMLVAPDGRLVVADAWHHRILIWDDIAAAADQAPPIVLGQPHASGLEAVDPGCGPQRFYWPFGIALVDGVFWVADTGNRRVLGWASGLPTPGQGADIVLGQPDLVSNGENRDDAVSASSMRWPHAIAASRNHLFVADAGNHRVLGWQRPVEGDRPADVVLGQPGFDTAFESPYRPQGSASYRFPYAVASDGAGRLFIADTSNNRIHTFDDVDSVVRAQPRGAGSDRVLAQPSFDANGENRWDRVELDTLCWPYGMSHRSGPTGNHLAVADSGNNRVILWDVGA